MKCFPSDLFPSRSPIKILRSLLFFPIRATRVANLTLLEVINTVGGKSDAKKLCGRG